MSMYVIDARHGESRPEWMAPIASELEKVEKKLDEAVSSDVPVAVDISMHLFSAGGKRVRPALVFLSAFALNCRSEDCRIVNIATAVELLHTASLVHDDVIDETNERRGVPTTNSEWGNKISVLGGDFMLSKAFQLLCADGDIDILRMLSNTAVKITESELLQAVSEGSLASWERDYWRIIDGKTAAFMGACCESGAIIAGADTTIRRAMHEFGIQMGLAFQITDDILDIDGDPASTGKEIGTDILNGKFTLPVLIALQKLEGDTHRRVLRCLTEGAISPKEAREIAQIVADCGAVTLAREAASNHITKACDQLNHLVPSIYKDALESLAVSTIKRKS